MSLQTLRMAGKEFVVIEREEYDRLVAPGMFVQVVGPVQTCH